MTTTPDRLRAARAAHGVTQAELAERLGITKAYVSQIETGRRAPSLGWLHEAAAAIGCSPSDLDDRLAPRG